MNNQIKGHATDSIDLRDLLKELLEKKRIILSVAFICLLFGSFYAIVRAPRYEASAFVQVDDNKSSTSLLGSLSKELNIGSSAGKDEASIQIVLIRSPFILIPVIHELGMDISAEPYRLPIIGRFFPVSDRIVLSKVEVPAEFKNKIFTLFYDSYQHVKLYNVKHQLVLEGPVGMDISNKDKTISIHVDSIDAPLNSRFTVIKYSDDRVISGLINKLKIVDLGLLLNKDAQKTGVLKITMTDTNPQLMINILNKIIEVVEIKDIERKYKESQKTLSFLKNELPIMRSSLEDAETNFNNYRAKSGRVDIKIQTQGLLYQLSELDKQLSELRANKSDMANLYTTDHPYMIIANSRIKELEKEKKQIELELTKLPASDQIATNLLRDVKVKNGLYLVLMEKIEELTITKASIVSDVRTLTLASLPDSSLPPSRFLMVMISFCIGIILGSLIVFLKKLYDTKVSDPRWVERHMSIVNLAIIPYSNENKMISQRLKTSKSSHAKLLAHTSPKDLSIEALRSLRTSLQVIKVSHSSNIISIMGISPSSGKSFISSNFAYLLAEAGKKVLLIDGDIRRGYLYRYFDTSRSPGLTELIQNKNSFDEVIRQTCHDDLFFIPTGSIVGNPSELLMGEALKNIMQQLSGQFDFVIIDTPPILAVTDGLLMAEISKINFLVIAADVHHPDEIEMAVKRVSNSNIELSGYIFNYLKPQIKAYGATHYQYDYATTTEH